MHANDDVECSTLHDPPSKVLALLADQRYFPKTDPCETALCVIIQKLEAY